jgi:hypothetical protein
MLLSPLLCQADVYKQVVTKTHMTQDDGLFILDEAGMSLNTLFLDCRSFINGFMLQQTGELSFFALEHYECTNIVLELDYNQNRGEPTCLTIDFGQKEWTLETAFENCS